MWAAFVVSCVFDVVPFALEWSYCHTSRNRNFPRGDDVLRSEKVSNRSACKLQLTFMLLRRFRRFLRLCTLYSSSLGHKIYHVLTGPSRLSRSKKVACVKVIRCTHAFTWERYCLEKGAWQRRRSTAFASLDREIGRTLQRFCNCCDVVLLGDRLLLVLSAKT